MKARSVILHNFTTRSPCFISGDTRDGTAQIYVLWWLL